MAIDLRDKTIIVTGASSGIGAATAVAAARAGMHVVLNARRVDKLAAVAEIIEREGRQAIVVPGDVAVDGVNERLLDETESRLGDIYAVFANAGYSIEMGFLDIENHAFRHLWDVNFFAAADLLRAAGRRLRDAGKPGHLLMCSSCLAKFTMPMSGTYSATKAAQAHICRSLRYELTGTGIEVASVHPVTTATEFFEVVARNSGKGPDEPTPLDQMPKMFIQPPERVAKAVIKCLQRPRSEVWTSLGVRLAAGIVTAFPGLIDGPMRRAALKARSA